MSKLESLGKSSVLVNGMVKFLHRWLKIYCLLRRAHNKQVSVHTGRGPLAEHQSYAEWIIFAGHIVNFAFMNTIVSRYRRENDKTILLRVPKDATIP